MEDLITNLFSTKAVKTHSEFSTKYIKTRSEFSTNILTSLNIMV